jgi:mono/diheme cytochrome c family protein
MNRQVIWILPALLGGLEACGSSAPGGAAVAPPAAQRAGAALYNGNCVACHQADGRGIPGVYPSLEGSALVLGDPRSLVRWIAKGQRAASMPAGRYPTAMPQFGWLKSADAAALATYLRSNFGNDAPAVDAATIAQELED